MAKRQQHVPEEDERKIIATFTDLAKKPKFKTLQQIIANLRPTLLTASEQGYTHKDLVETLKKLGYEISVVTLRKYLRTTTDGEAETEAETTQPEPATQASSTITAAAVKADDDIDAAIDAVKAVATSVVATHGVNAAVLPAVVEPSVVQTAPKVTEQVAALPTNPRPQLPLNTKVSEVNPTRQRAMLPLSPPPRTQAPAPPSSS